MNSIGAGDAGNYTVEVTDITNCQYLFTYDVFEPLTPLSASALVVDASCFGLSDGEITILPTGGTPPYNYSWSNGQNSQALTNVPIGTYTCTITDNNGCVAYATGTVNQPQQLTLTSSSVATSCFGYLDGTATAIPSGGTAPYTYNWSNGQNTQQAINLIAGTYSVVVTDDNNCVEELTIEIVAAPLFDIQPVVNSISCFGENDGNIQLVDETTVSSGGDFTNSVYGEVVLSTSHMYSPQLHSRPCASRCRASLQMTCRQGCRIRNLVSCVELRL